jgi:superkiller protein 3
MASIKTGLKAAKAAIDSQKFEEAVKQAQDVLVLDSQNYFA